MNVLLLPTRLAQLETPLADALLGWRLSLLDLLGLGRLGRGDGGCRWLDSGFSGTEEGLQSGLSLQSHN